MPFNELVKSEYGFLGDCIHLNCCSVGVPSMRVQDACRSYYDDFLTLVYGSSEGYGPHRECVREKVALLLGCEPEEIAFTGSTTEGLCVLAAGYPLGPGDNVVICDLENPIVVIAWTNAANNRGFDLRIVKTTNGQIHPHELFALCDAGTRLICLSAVQYGTGFLADIRAIGAECRARGVVFAVDAIQALGRIAIDVRDMNIDYLSCGGFKGLGASFGIGIIYCSNTIIRNINPAYAGACSVDGCLTAPQVFDAIPYLDFYNDARRLENGSHNSPGIVLLGASLDLIHDFGIINIWKHIQELEDLLRRELSVTQMEFTGPQSPENRSGIVVIYYPDRLYSQVKEILRRDRIILTLNPGYIRLAINCYNTKEQILTVSRAINEISELI